MGAIPFTRFFRLSDGGVQCGEDGLFVGSTPLLLRLRRPGGRDSWAVRPSDELESELSASYGLPIDVAAKRDGLAGVARALERGEMPLAKIATLLLRFPDPPSLAKDVAERGSLELATRLFESGLLKDWDESKHPRLGGPPNRGRFAVNPDKPAPPTRLSAPEGASAAVARAARVLIREAATAVAERWSLALWSAPILKAIEATLEVMSPSETNRGEQRVLDQLHASLDPPKTLDELQTEPTENELGYERHHIVEQNPANVAKSPIEVVIEKFGWDAIDDPSNIVWIPRLKHELITAYYNSTDEDDPDERLHRQVVNDMDFNGQREAGLAALRKFGVLQ